ncbi:group III truncated hemoglobin [Streptantibioticus ferralitis]|uniref:Group III truncated hemoglobin n=1 Tax=Streptantibioticus ferralitis TaxID=236510 RepID=A0ABT5YU05_9ACTN|nr:group III truncated hemoglobin [Streptantibioticus ferralitis]MDF2254806.1 group III truncated hemoglobin [Streptantibioticus ferralitis]
MAEPPAVRPAGRRDLADRDDVLALLDDFYRDVLTDEVLAPAFEAVGADVPAQLPIIADFWAGQLFGHSAYRGGLLRAHQRVHTEHPLTEAHFTRWVLLWNRAVDARWSGPVAERAKAQAARIATAMRDRLDGQRQAAAVDPADPSAPLLPVLAEQPESEPELAENGAGSAGAEGGDPACWLARVCPRCDAVADRDPPTRCARCGAMLSR